MKLCILDGDGVLWDNTARMAIADQAAQIVKRTIVLLEEEKGFTVDSKQYKQLIESARWDVAFHPELINLDWPMFNVQQQLAMLFEAGWVIWLMSSNPENTREQREQWLAKHDLVYQLILKDTGTDEEPRDRYVKTPIWKVNQVYHLLEQYGNKVDSLLFVDDQQSNRDAISKAFIDHQEMNVIVTDSLDLAVSLLEGQPKDFLYKVNPEG